MLTFETPPEANRNNRSSYWVAAAKELRENPGQWAIVGADVNVGVSSQIKNGKLAAFRPAGAFEAKTSRSAHHSRNRGVVWARYVGDETSPSDAAEKARAAFGWYEKVSERAEQEAAAADMLAALTDQLRTEAANSVTRYLAKLPAYRALSGDAIRVAAREIVSLANEGGA